VFFSEHEISSIHFPLSTDEHFRNARQSVAEANALLQRAAFVYSLVIPSTASSVRPGPAPSWSGVDSFRAWPSDAVSLPTDSWVNWCLQPVITHTAYTPHGTPAERAARETAQQNENNFLCDSTAGFQFHGLG